MQTVKQDLYIVADLNEEDPEKRYTVEKYEHSWDDHKVVVKQWTVDEEIDPLVVSMVNEAIASQQLVKDIKENIDGFLVPLGETDEV